jgi:hypothetical protein
MTIEYARLVQLSRTSQELSQVDPVLMSGELAVANAASTFPDLRIGDGIRPWSLLQPFIPNFGDTTVWMNMLSEVEALVASVGDNSASILRLNQVVANMDPSGILQNLAPAVTELQRQIAGIGNTVVGFDVSIGALDQAIIAQATEVSTLTTRVGQNTATITTMSTSINGLQAQWAVAIDNNGYIAGIQLASGIGGMSSFTVVANRFAIIDPGNGLYSPVVPFLVQGGVVRMGNVVIDAATIGNLVVGTSNIAAGAVTNSGYWAQSGVYTWNVPWNQSSGAAVVLSTNYSSPVGGRVLVFCEGRLRSAITSSGAASQVVYTQLQFRIDGVTQVSAQAFAGDNVGGVTAGFGFGRVGNLSTWFSTNMSAGNHTLDIAIWFSVAGGTVNFQNFADFCRFILLELKR